MAFRRSRTLYAGAALVALLAAAVWGWNYYVSLGTAYVTTPLQFYDAPFKPVGDPSRRAYATTIYNEHYVPGALLLGWSLRKHGMLNPDIAQRMLLLHIPGRLSNASLALLESVGWEARAVEHIPHPAGRPPASNFMDQYTKLRLFELEGEFDAVFYMDADMLVFRPFPEIWDFPSPFAASRDVRMGSGWLPTINAGSLLLKPNKRLLKHMLEIAPTFKYNIVFAEQALLNAYWARDLTILPYIFNGQLGIKRVYPHVWPSFAADVRIVHYTGTKPWEWHEASDMPLERAQWWAAWEEMEAQRVKGGLASLGKLGRDPKMSP
ncbi:nucleotide-diphospho-sugar transferase [Exidia glandulosa HHB12029]|uniref:Nucleotide-diphospho-sugar transferase n=1 Tax=Exidia glandulosa HHB12029 TaxID=1314781 RepID=A0A166B1Z2_EXIGL|nr:nucleotide-diphospho-sugar transferase [Exidia glandulosa HHB12029]